MKQPVGRRVDVTSPVHHLVHVLHQLWQWIGLRSIRRRGEGERREREREGGGVER